MIFFHQKHWNDIDNAPKADAKRVCTVKSNISTKYQWMKQLNQILLSVELNKLNTFTVMRIQIISTWIIFFLKETSLTTFVFNKAPVKLTHLYNGLMLYTHTVRQRETAMRAHTHERTIPKQDAIWWQKSLANQARLCGVTWNENSIYRNLVVFEINRIALRRLD